MALRNKSFGSAQEFVWSYDSSVYAIREGSTAVKIFKNFKEQKSFKPDFGCEGKSFINPLPYTPILGSSISAANKEMMSKIWTNGGKLSY